MPKPARDRESGYALLFIFLSMAIVGITFYTAMPRVAFEAQRDQEQLLIDRGEQYKRAIQVYFRKFKKYPVKIEDLENTASQRFLRQRYVDPMTGKDEWRPIHVGPNGVFIDSLTQKNNKKKDPASVNNFVTELQGLGDIAAPSAGGPVSVGLRHRASDQTSGAGVDPNFPSSNGNSGNDLGIYGPQGNPNNLPGALAIANNVNPNNGLPNQSLNQPNAQGRNQSGAEMIRNILTSPRPGGPPPGIYGGDQINDVGFINQNGNTNPGGGNNGPQPTAPQPVGNGLGGSSTGGSSGTDGGFGSGPGGGGAQNGTPLGSNPGGQTVGGGIAGFASKDERAGIKIYNERENYNEWEFIYDYAKDKTMGGGQLQNIPNQNKQNPQTPVTPNPNQDPTQFGNTPTPTSPQQPFRPTPMQPAPVQPTPQPQPPPTTEQPPPTFEQPPPSFEQPVPTEQPTEQPFPVEQPVPAPEPGDPVDNVIPPEPPPNP